MLAKTQVHRLPKDRGCMITVDFLTEVLHVARNCVRQGEPLPLPSEWKYWIFVSDEFTPVSFLYSKLKDDYAGVFQLPRAWHCDMHTS